jgi:hypothetical protein
VTSNTFRAVGLIGAVVVLAGMGVAGRLVSGTVAVVATVAVIGLVVGSSMMLHHATHLRILDARKKRRRDKANRATLRTETRL